MPELVNLENMAEGHPLEALFILHVSTLDARNIRALMGALRDGGKPHGEREALRDLG
jgi:hypothetical protein